jgi:hypothetical protein
MGPLRLGACGCVFAVMHESSVCMFGQQQHPVLGMICSVLQPLTHVLRSCAVLCWHAGHA